ncbi:unnamed protein product [Rangifer tarandus platyrhynchus]|uniref:Uncharacterized protein n=2 Tax=Rangifer tarandus platyrhynchus TaxID=3082113 RepID=A0AC59ZC38_RANTA|nr:unnamed protein product [Rangifer tarandus platyrhynchus]
MCYMDTVPGRKQALLTQAFLLASGGLNPQTSRNDVRIICIPLLLPARSSWDPASPAPWPEGWVSVYGEEGWTLVSLDVGVPQAHQPPGLSMGPSPSNLHSSPHSTSSSCERGALPRDLHRLRQDRHEWGPLEKLGSRGPRGTPENQGETLGGG